MKKEIVAFLILMDQLSKKIFGHIRSPDQWKGSDDSTVFELMHDAYQNKRHIPAPTTLRDYRYMCLGRKPFSLPSADRCDLLCKFSDLVKWEKHLRETISTLEKSPKELEHYLERATKIRLANKKQKQIQDFYDTYEGYYNVMFIEEGSTLEHPLFGLSTWQVENHSLDHYFISLENHALIKSQWHISKTTDYDFQLTEDNDEWGFSARVGIRPTKRVEDFGFHYHGIREIAKSTFSGNAYAIKAFKSTERLLPLRMKPRSFFVSENIAQCKNIEDLSFRFTRDKQSAIDIYNEAFRSGQPVQQYYLNKINKVINILISKGIPTEH